MKSELAHDVSFPADAETCSRPLPDHFELAYQARVAIDRIRFAINATERLAPSLERSRKSTLQLLDAIDRLQTAELNFQKSYRTSTANGNAESAN
jgi:hypothetical protein